MNEDEFVVTSTLDEVDIGELKLKVCENAKDTLALIDVIKGDLMILAIRILLIF